VAEANGRSIVVQGPAKPPELLERAAADGALVVADSLAELRRLAAAGVTRVGVRVSLPGVGHGTSHFGVPMSEVPMAPRHAAAVGLRIEALAVHLVSAGFDTPLSADARLASHLVVRWPQPPDRFATAARMLAGLAGRMGVPVIDVGGGFPPAPREALYARAIAGAIGGAGFEGRVLVEPGRALVADAVDLACTVTAVKRLADRRRCVVLDAGMNLLPGTLFAWPQIEALGVTDPAASPALVTGPLCTNVDVLHPAADLGAVSEGDAVVIRSVGAYQQSQSTQFGDLRPAVVARDDGHWQLVSRRERVEDLIASDLGADVAHATR
jgi:diaminopimelate decarboxylase